MDWLFFLVFQVVFLPCLAEALFTVAVEQATYTAEFRGDIVMGCKFQPAPPSPNRGLRVTWHKLMSTVAREVYRLDSGEEQFASQDPAFRGRVRLLTEDLTDGWAKLQVSRLRINDSGTYQCLVQTDEEADYKQIALSVVAPYKNVTKSIQKVDGNWVLLTCQSEGFPETSVTWQDGNHKFLNHTTAAVSTQEQLRRITTQIRVSTTDRNNYTCSFMNGVNFAMFRIPEEVVQPPSTNQALVICLLLAIVLVLVAAAVLIYKHRRGNKTKPNCRRHCI